MVFTQSRPVSESNGFSMDGYYIWGGTVARYGGKWVMLASRWPRDADRKGRNELDGYRTASEIVRAVSDTAEGPFAFDRVILGKRNGGYWDSLMTHNPYLYQHRGKHYLFYIGSRNGDPARRIGCAPIDHSLTEVNRPDTEISLTDDANNPAPYALPDGRTALMFRDRELNVYIAVGVPGGRFAVIARNLFKDVKLEDFCVYPSRSGYRMICEDNRGQITGNHRWGAVFHSGGGITGWKAVREPAYDHTVQLDCGKTLILKRRERPQVIFGDTGHVSHLITSALTENGSKCLVIPVEDNQER